MLLSQSAEYAIRSILHLSRGSLARYADVGELAAKAGCPPSYLAKVLGQLVRAGVLTSARGPGGGFRLAREPHDITLESVVSVFDSVGDRRCLLGEGVCGEQPACAVHRLWFPVATQLREFLNTTTIADLSRSTSQPAGGAL